MLWRWHRLAAAFPIQSLGWELPSAAGVALKRKKKKKEFDLKLDLTSIQINLAIFEKLENMVCSVLNHGLLCQGITQQQQDHMNTYKWVMHKVVSELIK